MILLHISFLGAPWLFFRSELLIIISDLKLLYCERGFGYILYHNKKLSMRIFFTIAINKKESPLEKGAHREISLSLSLSLINTHTHTYIYIYRYTHTHIYIYIHTHIHTHTHTHTYIYKRGREKNLRYF